MQKNLFLFLLALCLVLELHSQEFKKLIIPKTMGMKVLLKETFNNSKGFYTFPDDSTVVTHSTTSGKLFISRNNKNVRHIFLRKGFYNDCLFPQFKLKCGSIAEYQSYGLVFGHKSDSDYWVYSYYPRNNELKISHYLNNRETVVLTKTLQLIVGDEPQSDIVLLLSNLNGLIECGINNNILFSTSILPNQLLGSVGLFISEDGMVAFDDLEIISKTQIERESIFEDKKGKKIQALLHPISSIANEFNAIAFENQLYFTRSDDLADENVMVVDDFDILKKQSPKNLESINSLKPNSILSITKDGRALINGNYDSEFFLYEGKIKEGKIDNINKLDIPNLENYAGSITGCFSPDGNTLLLSITNSKSDLSKDLYCCNRISDNYFTSPILVEGCNSNGDECFPSYSKDGKFIYFSSNGYGVEGDRFGVNLDIFKAEIISRNPLKVKNIFNIGNEVNTNADEISYIEELDVEKGTEVSYFSRMEEGNFNLFRVEKILQKTVLNQKNDSLERWKDRLKGILSDAYIQNSKRDLEVDEKLLLPSKPISVQIYDDEQNDGDTISLYINGSKIIDHLGISQEPVQIEYKFIKKGLYFIELRAENIGINPPNTAAIKFIGMDKKDAAIHLSSDMDRSGVLLLEVH